MSSQKSQVLAYQFSKTQKRIITPVCLYPLSSSNKTQSVVTNALWDTGATLSAIRTDIANQLKLDLTDKIRITGAHTTDIVDAGIITIELPDHIVKKNVRVAVCNLNPNIGMILDMDIITLGDFSLLNGQGHTVFSFTTPPRGALS